MLKWGDVFKGNMRTLKVNPIFFRVQWECHMPVIVSEDDLGKKQQATPHLDEADKWDPMSSFEMALPPISNMSMISFYSRYKSWSNKRLLLRQIQYQNSFCIYCRVLKVPPFFHYVFFVTMKTTEWGGKGELCFPSFRKLNIWHLLIKIFWISHPDYKLFHF